MNIYVVVEGAIGEKKVYERWIPLVNPGLQFAATLDEVDSDHFFIISGGGYPNYFEVIESAVADVSTLEKDNALLFDRLVISADSEEMSFSEKKDELEDFTNDLVSQAPANVDYRLIIQHFCLETWGLGNRKIVTRNVRNRTLQSFKQLYDVRTLDPEGLPPLPNEQLNRSQFAERYLRLLLLEKFRNLTYRKGNPRPLLHATYYREVKKRLEDTGHIGSFQTFLDAFN